MQFGALGDIHGDFAAVNRILGAHPEVAFWLCVGDVADDHGRYAPFEAPVYWIKGNNENFDAIAAGDFPDNVRYLPNAELIDVRGIRIAGLGGTLAPSWYDTAAADLPHPKKGSASSRATSRDDKRRHFVREEVARCRAMRGVDVLLTHEAPRPYRAAGVRMDMGKTPINEVLADMQPRLHLFGHHHRFTDQERQHVRSIGLDLVSRSYLLIDASTFRVDVVTNGTT